MSATDAIAAKVSADVAAIGNNIDQLRMAAETNAATVAQQQKELRKLEGLLSLAKEEHYCGDPKCGSPFCKAMLEAGYAP